MVTTAPEQRFVRIGDQRLHYLDWGGPSDRVVVLLHGLTSNAHAWDQFVAPEYLSPEKFRILALDQRGHGDSDHARDYSIRCFIDDIHGFATELGLDQYDLIGHSMGARHAMAYAGDHWQALRHLVLVDFGPEMERSGAVAVRSGTTQRPASFRNIEQAVEYFSQANPTRTPDDWKHTATHALRQNYAGRLVWKHDPEINWISGAFGLTEVPFLWEQVARIQCPTLIVRGETSEVLGRGVMERMLKVMPTTRAVEIAGAGHGVPQDQPRAFWDAVNAFLDE